MIIYYLIMSLNQVSVVLSLYLVLVKDIIHVVCFSVNIGWSISDFPPFFILNELLHAAQRSSKELFFLHITNVQPSRRGSVVEH